jgi:hypothetical protein
MYRIRHDDSKRIGSLHNQDFERKWKILKIKNHLKN